MDWLQFIATIVVAVIGVVGIKIQTSSKEKTDNIDLKLKGIDDKFTKITDNFAASLDSLKKESKAGDETISTRMDNFKMVMMKITLINEMTKIRDGVYVPNEEQKALLKDTKNEYNKAGGDSYVDDMYDDMRDQGML